MLTEGVAVAAGAAALITAIYAASTSTSHADKIVKAVSKAKAFETPKSKSVQERGYWMKSLGRPTHVANHYNLPILASVRESLEQDEEFITIPPKEYVKFVFGSPGNKKVFVTIRSVDENGDTQPLCLDEPKDADDSLLVGIFGSVLQMGHVWQKISNNI